MLVETMDMLLPRFGLVGVVLAPDELMLRRNESYSELLGL